MLGEWFCSDQTLPAYMQASMDRSRESRIPPSPQGNRTEPIPMINVADTINVLCDYFNNMIQWSDSITYSLPSPDWTSCGAGDGGG